MKEQTDSRRPDRTTEERLALDQRLRAESERLANDPVDLAEVQAILADAEDMRIPE